MASEISPKGVVSCPFCLTLNAVSMERVRDRPKCGSCERPLLLDRPLAAHDDDLARTIAQTTVPVVVDFHADWCGPCKVMAPIFDELAGRYAGRILFIKIDSDRNPLSTRTHEVRALPTLIIFRDGREVQRQLGAISARQLEAMLQAGLSDGRQPGPEATNAR